MFIMFGRVISLIRQTLQISLHKNNSHDLHIVITHTFVLAIISLHKNNSHDLHTVINHSLVLVIISLHKNNSHDLHLVITHSLVLLIKYIEYMLDESGVRLSLRDNNPFPPPHTIR